jgi:hypothetical protein
MCALVVDDKYGATECAAFQQRSIAVFMPFEPARPSTQMLLGKLEALTRGIRVVAH